MTEQPSICTVPENRKAMFSFTFDDGTLDHLLIAAPELEKRGWHGTFYINPRSNDRAPSKHLSCSQIRELSDRGHEIGNHTMSHSNVSSLPPERIAWEISECSRILRNITGKKVASYTAPCGLQNAFLSRLLECAFILNTPPRTGFGQNTNEEDVNNLLQKILQPGTFTVGAFHGVAPGFGGWSPLKSADFFRHILDVFQRHEEDLYIDTFAANAHYRLRAAHTRLEEIQADTFLVKLDPEYSFAEGFISLNLQERTQEIRINQIPVVSDLQGNVNVFPGDVIFCR